MREIQSRAVPAAVLGLLLLTAPAAGQDSTAVERYEDRDFPAVLERLPASHYSTLQRPDRLLHLRALARSGHAYEALEPVESLLQVHPEDADVLATAAVVHHAAGDLEAAETFARCAIARDPTSLAALRSQVVLRLHRHDPRGALDSYLQIRQAYPRLKGRAWDVLYAQSLAEALGDGSVRAEALEDRARRLESRAEAGVGDAVALKSAATDARNRAALYRRIAGRPQFRVEAEADRVALPFRPCWDGTPYRCVEMEVEGSTYQVLLDTGNEYGFGVHHSVLRDALMTDRGGETTVTTGSVDSAFAAHDFFADSVAIGPMTIRNVPAVASPKAREPWFDANLNPFLLRDRVITLDYVNERVLVRTKDRFERDLAAAPDHRVVRVPVLDNDRPYIRVRVNDSPATAMVETGGEVLGLTTGFGRRAGLELTPDSMAWNGRTLHFHTADVEVRAGGLQFLRDTVRVWPGRIIDRDSGLIYDVIIGPGSLEDGWALSYDPFDQTVILERGGAATAGPPR